jgi:hypothetical protein
MEKFIYPNVFMHLHHDHRQKEVLTFDTYLRKKHRGKYYLWHFHWDREIEVGEGKREYSILLEIEQFHGEVYRTIILGKVSTKIIDPRYNTQIFELDPDQTPEEERLMVGCKW